MISSCPDTTLSSTYLQDCILKTPSVKTVRGIFSAFPIAAGLVWKLGACPSMIAHTVYGIRAMNVWISQYDS